LSCGSVVEMPWIGRVKALVHGYLGGQAGARALLRVLSGDVNPSGKLAETYPLAYADTPSYRHFPGREATVEYREGPFIGYRYFDTAGVPVLFPFGFGLSYTTFAYSNLEVTPSGVRFQLTNTGSVAGMEVAQLYVGLPGAKVFRPAKELKGFAKVFINAGETKTVSLAFDERTFRYFNVKTNRWEVEGGEYRLMVGASSADIRLTGTIGQEGTGAASPYDPVVLASYYTGRVADVGQAEFEALLGRPVPPALWDREAALGYNDTIAQCQYAKGLGARAAFGLLRFARWLLWKTGNRGTANLLMMSVYHMPFRGVGRMTGGLVTMGMVDGLLLMANGHFWKGLGHVIQARKTPRN
jgi:beta-glucosidase